MKEKLVVYPAIFTHTFENKTEYFEVSFIDFDCNTFGTSISEAFFMAQDAMGLLLEDKIELPKVTVDIKDIKLEKNQFINFVTIDLNEYRRKNNNKAVKKTLTIPEWLNIMAESENINFSQTLQEALKEKLEID